MPNLITRLGLDSRLRTDSIRRYALQCSLATVVVLILLVALDAVTQTVLIAGCAHPQVSLHTPERVAVLDAQLTGAASAQFTVGVEDGRLFHNCVVKSLEARGKRRYHYGMVCEGVSGP